MKINKKKDVEYQALRDNIMKLFEFENRTRIVVYTVTPVLLAFAFSQENSYLFLSPMSIIIPSAFRYLSFKQEIEKIGSYIQVFHEDKEGENWENRLSILRYKITSPKEKMSKVIISFFHHADFLILTTISLLLFNLTEPYTHIILKLLISIVLFVLMLYLHIKTITLKMKDREKYIQDWKKVQQVEYGESFK